MKIGFHALDLPEGKVKYLDPRFVALEDKFQPKKSSPYSAELLKDEFVQCDVIVIARAALLDLLILDMEKLEARAGRAENEAEKGLIARCLALLEAETPLCDGPFDEAERQALRGLALASVKPVVVATPPLDASRAIALALGKAGIVFFFTAAKSEVHAWPVAAGSDAITCAGKIHTDLARGFIRADVVAFDDFRTVHGMQEARTKGLVKVVERDHVICDGDIIEIKFSV